MADVVRTVKELRFVVPGEPVGKGRPRFVRATGKTYTPEKTANFETLVRWEYHRQCGGDRMRDGAQIGIRIEALFAIPKSKPKKVQRAMENGTIMHTSRPDADNCLKAIADALNHIAYQDDSAIAYAEVVKRYSRTPETRVTIYEMEVASDAK